MKKIWKSSFLLILLSVFLFVGCAEEAPPPPTPTPEIDNTLGITPADVLSALIAWEDSFVEIDSTQFDGLTLIEFGGFDPVQITVFAVVEEGEDRVSALLVTLSSSLRNVPLRNWERTGAQLSRLAPEDAHADEFEHRGLRIFSIRALDAPFTNEQLGAIVRPEATIFNYHSEELRQYLNVLDFPGMLTLIESYVDTHELASDDATHRLHELALQGAALSDGIVHVTDSFDGSVNVYFGDLRRVSQTVNVVPFFDASNGRFHLRLGFHRNGWVFFEHTSLRIEEGVHYNLRHDYFEVNRTVLAGAMISEERIISLPTTHLGRLLDDDYATLPLMIRFSSRDDVPPLTVQFDDEDDGIHDHELTPVEVEALRRFTQLAQVNSAMNAIFRQNQ